MWPHGYRSYVFTFVSRDKKERKQAQIEKAKKEKQDPLRPDDTFIVPEEPRRARPVPPNMKKSNKHILVEFGMRVSSSLYFLLFLTSSVPVYIYTIST